MASRIADISSFSRGSSRGRSSVAAYVVATSWIAVGASVGATATACGGGSASSTASPSASASAGDAALSSAERAAGAFPVASSVVRGVINANNLPDYAGPVGTVVGHVKVTGDPAPLTGVTPITGDCPDARAMYEKLFRAGPDGALADTIIGVTDYKGFVPAKSDVVPVRIHGCAFQSRAITMTFGQRIDIINNDQVAYLPHLDGSRAPALLVSVPKANPVGLYPREPGVFRLTDDMRHGWMIADVFVFKFSTHDVSKEDGSFRIEGIPVGSAKLSARHPRIKNTIDRPIEIRAGEITTVDIEIPFNAKTDTPTAQVSQLTSATPSGSASGSAKPRRAGDVAQ